MITLAVFSTVLSADFVMWDDDWLIYLNPRMAGMSLQTACDILVNTHPSSSWYTPLIGLRWAIIYDIWELDPFGYHLVNWLVHGAGAGLLFLVLRRLLALGMPAASRGRLTRAAAIGALIWSLHPLRVEPVASVASAGYGQAMLLLLLALSRISQMT